MTEPSQHPFEATIDVEVRYAETDQMGVVYYANHLVWFEMGRTELIREMGLTYRDMEEKGVFLPVVSAQVNYRTPARYDDVVEIRASPSTSSTRRVFTFSQSSFVPVT